MTSTPPVDRETAGRRDERAGPPTIPTDYAAAASWPAMLVKIAETLCAGEANRTDRDERDERDEQRVLEQVLAFFVANRLHEIQQHRH